MGWWDIGHGDDVAGDEAADIVTEALATHAKKARTRRGSRPSLDALLEALGRVLHERGDELLSDAAEAQFQSLRATGVKVKRGAGAKDDGEDPQLLKVLAGALEEITEAYQDALDRKPRLREVLANFTFVLGSDTGDYVDGVEGELDEIIAA